MPLIPSMYATIPIILMMYASIRIIPIIPIVYAIIPIITEGLLSGPGYRASAIWHPKGIAHSASLVGPKFRIWYS